MDYLAQVDIGGTFNSPFGQGQTLGGLVSIILQAAIVIAGIILLFLFIFGGIGMIAGAGNNNPEQAAKGKQAVTSAVIGFIVVFAAYWVVRLIEVITGVPFVTSPTI
jgi:hypothetical protein